MVQGGVSCGPVAGIVQRQRVGCMVITCLAVLEDIGGISVGNLGVAQPQRILDLALVKDDIDGHVGGGHHEGVVRHRDAVALRIRYHNDTGHVSGVRQIFQTDGLADEGGGHRGGDGAVLRIRHGDVVENRRAPGNHRNVFSWHGEAVGLALFREGDPVARFGSDLHCAQGVARVGRQGEADLGAEGEVVGLGADGDGRVAGGVHLNRQRLVPDDHTVHHTAAGIHHVDPVAVAARGGRDGKLRAAHDAARRDCVAVVVIPHAIPGLPLARG